jgi:hypothetical protein
MNSLRNGEAEVMLCDFFPYEVNEINTDNKEDIQLGATVIVY